MSGRLTCIFTELFTMAELSQGLLSSNFNLYRGSKQTIGAYPMSFLIVFIILMILVSLSYWHPLLYKYYEVLDDETEYNSSVKFLRRNDDSDSYASDVQLLNYYKGRYTNIEPELLPYNGRCQSLALQRTNPPIDFIPNEADLSVSGDLGQIVRIPTVIGRSQEDNLPKGTEKEALSAVTMALKMKKANKHEKAQKLFNHALALQPLHPDVLNHFGEFLEEKNNIIKADHLFLRALTVNPDHSRALVNRKRTLPVVNELDEKELKRIDEKQVELMKSSHNNPALNRLKKELYFQHIYHTVAIEGNTMTLEDTRMVIETGLPVSGKSLSEHMEIVGVESALRFINKTLITKEIITIFDILEVHKLVLGHVKPRIAGSFRQSQVFVHKHTPPLAADVAYLMDEYVEWIQSYEFTQLHPVKQAALAHYKFVFIHPFVDGNGRTARLIMNMILMRYGYPPVIIRNNERNHYFRTLQVANEGDVRPFVRFIAHCTECTLNAYLLSGGDYNVKGLMALEPKRYEDNSDIIAL